MMRTVTGLLLAVLVTLVLGTASLALSVREPFAGSAVLGAIGALVSIALGPLVLWWRGTRPLIPIAAVYCVLIVIPLMFIVFQIAWALGKVDF